jgi:hypothetical protein
MNLVVLNITKFDNKVLNQQYLFNCNAITNIEEIPTGARFQYDYKNFKHKFQVTETVDYLVSATADYNYGTKIELDILKINNKDVNKRYRLSVNDITAANRPVNITEITLGGSGKFKRYTTFSSLQEISDLANASATQGETFTMSYGQTTINTVMILSVDHKIFINGSLQGYIKDLAEWTITSNKVLTYSGQIFYGGEIITITR